MKPNLPSKTELVIVILLAILLIILWTTAIGNDTIDLSLHDTYIVMKNTKEKIFVFPILMAVTIVYIIKEGFYGYRRRRQNIVLLICVLLMNIVLAVGAAFAGHIIHKIDGTQGGWTIYPPLSALPKDLPANLQPYSSTFHGMWHAILYIQIFFMLILVIIALITGINWNATQRENQVH